MWEVEGGGGGRGSHNDDARYSKKKEENISLPRTVMNEKAEGRLISFFRFNKSLPSRRTLFTATILFPMALERRGASFLPLLRPTRESRYIAAVRKELPPNQNSFP